ncbi:fad dependent oxidoreductase [Diplodia corticola]|uniref:Fad dependent oxidoreductase n=1 Tax=Diplodia corticola TaxID=236234 RepID=A0A1J9S2W0_9PEZI|nr:fad dependent oxidoreductase [Diplodia corticola]OJD33973.1 fad dependent oxidoreductase [Diplodia corticola]
MEAPILIIGSGTFGASTAYHLAKRGYTDITCIDKNPFPSVDSAAYDLNKIIRTEYDEPLYSDMAIEAIQAWRQPLFADIFHETGWLVTTSGDPEAAKRLRQAYQNLVDRGQAEGVEFVETKQDIVKHVPQLAAAKGIDEWKGFWNPQAGWAHARKALEKVGGEAMSMGVRFIGGPDGQMVGIEEEDGKVKGVRVASGKVHTASKYILCTGAASPAVLPELAPHLWSKCWTLGHVEVTDEELAQFKNCPVVDNRELGFFFEPDPETRWIKICNEFQGYQYRVGEYQDGNKTTQYSVPYYASEHPGEGIPEEAMDGIKKLVDAVIPQFSGRKIHGASICWCTDTADRHFLFDFHPKYPGNEFLLATGDSGHGFKFLPIIGSYIADALEGKERGLRQEWRWHNRPWGHDDSRPGERVKDLREVGLGKRSAPNL